MAFGEAPAGTVEEAAPETAPANRGMLIGPPLMVAIHRGDLDRARAILDEFDQVRGDSAVAFESDYRSLREVALAYLDGAYAEALSIIARAQSGDYAEWPSWLPLAVDLVSQLPGEEALRDAADALGGDVVPKTSPYVTAQSARVGALLAHRSGDSARAAEQWSTAIGVVGEAGMAFHEAALRLELFEHVASAPARRTICALSWTRSRGYAPPRGSSGSARAPRRRGRDARLTAKMPVPPPPETVRLRPWRADDAREIAVMAEDDHVRRWSSLPDDVEAWLVRERAEARGPSRAICLAGEDRVLGKIAVRLPGRASPATTCAAIVASDHPVGELSYWLVPAARGRGLAHAAVLAMMRSIADATDVRSVVLDIEECNAASMRLALRLGAERRQPSRVEMDRTGVARTLMMFVLKVAR
ncbi:MAG: GNAT family N-acetyltransferase [Solirubrobacteraceae bacterium]